MRSGFFTHPLALNTVAYDAAELDGLQEYQGVSITPPSSVSSSWHFFFFSEHSKRWTVGIHSSKMGTETVQTDKVTKVFVIVFRCGRVYAAEDLSSLPACMC